MVSRTVAATCIAIFCAVFAPIVHAQMARPVLYGPAGLVVSDNPTYVWEGVPGATMYALAVYNPTVGYPVSEWVYPSDAGCSGGGRCRWKSASTLPDGWPYTWYVQAYTGTFPYSLTPGPTSLSNQFLAAASSATAPATPQLIEPAGTYFSPTTTSVQPLFRWLPSPRATSYVISVMVPPGGGLAGQWIMDPGGVGCGGGVEICELQAPYGALSSGNYYWAVRAQNDAGSSAMSAASYFYLDTTSTPPTFAPATIAPNGTVSNATPTFTWNAAPWARAYALTITSGGATVFYSAYWDSYAGCPIGLNAVCSATPNIQLAPGNYQWNVQDYYLGTSGVAKNFTIAPAAPSTPTLFSPSGTVPTVAPPFNWNAVANAQLYHLVVQTTSGSSVFDAYIDARTAGCGSGTGVCSVLIAQPLANGGSYTWSVSAVNPTGTSAMSAAATITVNTATLNTPATPVLVGPSGPTAPSSPTFQWNASAWATDYLLTVWNPSGTAIVNASFSAFTAGCASGTGVCSITPSMTMPAGGYAWSVRAVNAYGASAYASAMAFNPSAPVLTFNTTSVSFPPQYYGTTSTTQNVTVTNNGLSTLNVTTFQTQPDFYVPSHTCGSVAPGGTCTAQVVSTPAALGTRTSTLTAVSNSAGSASASLSGSGTGPTFAGVPIDDVNAGGPGGDATATSVLSSRNNDSSPQGRFAPSGLKEGGEGGEGTGADDIRMSPFWHGFASSTLINCPYDGRNCNIIVNGYRFGFGDPFFGGFFSPNHSPLHTGPGGGEPKDPCGKSASLTSDVFTTENYQHVLVALNDHGSSIETPESEFVLDPVHSGTGNKHHSQVDYVGQDRWPLSTLRTYNSQPFQSSAMVRVSFGPGWFSNWDKSVNVTGTSARVSRGNGRSFVFNWNGTAWVATNSRSQLQQLTSGGSTTGWRYTTKAGDVENFDAQGRLTSLTALTGETYTLTYNAANGRLQSVQNPLGRSIQFTYNSDGRVATITDPAGNQLTYTYDLRGRLVSVTYPPNAPPPAQPPKRQYVYGDATNAFALTSIIDENNQVYASFGYYSDNRAWTNSFAGSVGNGSISYPSGTSSSTTTPDGTSWTRAFAVNNGKVQMTSLAASCSDCGTASEIFGYDGLGQLSSYTNRSGIVTTYTYNDRGLPLTITEGGIRTRTYTWHPTLSLPTQIAGQLSTTSYVYDTAGHVTQKTISGGAISRTWTYTYDAQGRLTQEKGPRTDVQETTSYTYDAAGNIATVTNALGQVTRYTSYDAHGNPLAITYPNGTMASFSYDARGRLKSKSIAGQTTTYSYNAVGDLASETDPALVVTSYTYDAAHRLTQMSRLGETTVYTLDSSGRTIKTEVFDSTNFLVRTSSVAYDGLGRVKQRTGANGQVTTISYDDRGNPTQVVDPLGNTTSTSYDALNRPILVTDPLLHTVRTAYDDNDKVTSITDPNSNTTTYTNNAIGEQTGITSPDTGLTTMALNSGGMVATKTDARGASATYTYDALGRITQTTFSDGAGITKTYDVATNGVGRLATMTDPSGSTSYTYDSFGRTASKTQVVSGISKTITYGRDSIGRVTSITYPSGKILAITYQNGRIVSLTFNGQTIASGIQYFPFGAPESWLFGGTKEYTRYIDKDERIASYLTPSGQRNLTFDAGSRITRIDNVVSGTTTGSQTFTYDALGRLVTFSGYTSASPSESQSFTYDANGNRLSNTLNGAVQTYSYTAGTNRLATVTFGGTPIISNTFDASGNTLSDGARSLIYDARGRMVQAVYGGITTSYLYNASGLRVKKSNTSLTRMFVYDDVGHMLGEYDSTGAVVQELVWLEDTPLAVATTSTTGYIWTDHLNTPREITNSTNQSLWRWDSLPFGETMPNDNPSGLGSFPFNHRFSGQYYDQESALHQNWHRDYNPQLGRYLQSDLLGLLSGYSTYGYAKLNPIQRNDPLGFAPCLTWATGAESFLHDLGTAVVHAAAGSGLLGPCLQRYSRQLESNVASNASLIAEALADKNFLHNALTAAGIAVDDASEAILGRMLTAAAATWMTGSAASVLALSGSVLNHLGGISPDVMARVVASIQNREISPEVVQIIRELAEIAAGSC